MDPSAPALPVLPRPLMAGWTLTAIWALAALASVTGLAPSTRDAARIAWAAATLIVAVAAWTLLMAGIRSPQGEIPDEFLPVRHAAGATAAAAAVLVPLLEGCLIAFLCAPSPLPADL